MSDSELLQKGSVSKRKRTAIDKRFGKIITYDITKNELSTLQQGGDSGMFKDIGICTLSVAVTIFTTYFSGGFNTEIITGAFIAIAAILLIISIISGIFFFKRRNDISTLCDDIRNRSE